MLEFPSVNIPDIGNILGIKPAAVETPKTPANFPEYLNNSFAEAVKDAKNGKVQTPKKENWNIAGQYGFAILEQKGSSFSVYGDSKYLITLRIPPQSLSITSQFASSVIATNNGILEEHNGSIFSMISISGTTGLLPDRATVVKPTGALQAVGNAIAPNLTSAIGGLVKSVSRTLNKLGITSEESDIDLTKTGYFQFWALHHLFKTYAELKKIPGNENLRLSFFSTRDGTNYLCTPVTFEMRRDISAPMQYRYAIALRAWKLVEDVPKVDPVKLNLPTPLAPSLVAGFINLINQARLLIDQSFNVLNAINSDWVRVLQAYEQCQLFGAEIAGIDRRFNEFQDLFKGENRKKFVEPIQNQTALLKALNDNGQKKSLSDLSVTTPSQQTSGTTQNSLTSAFNSRTEASSTATSRTASEIAKSSLQIDSKTALNDALNSKITPGGETDVQKSASAIPSSAGQLIDQALDLIKTANLDEFEIHPDIQTSIDAKIEATKSLDANDVRNLIADLKKTSDSWAQSINASNLVYEDIYDVPAITITTKPQPTEDDILLGVALQESISSFTSFLATGQMFPEQEKDPFVMANENMETVSQMSSAQSAYPIVFPRGSSLAQIAQEYLGDSIREHEIALLNNLKAPFIDEAGFEQSITGAINRSFVVDNREKLAIGQRIILKGTGLADSARSIINIEDIGGGKFKVSVDGAANLAIYSPGLTPKLKARLPFTIGSNDTILIPSAVSLENETTLRTTPLSSRISYSEKVFKIDLGLDTNGQDLLVSAGGDIKRSYGYENAVQAIRLMLETEQGELERHPSYGFPAVIGGRTSTSPIDQIKNLVQTRIMSDGRFTSAQVKVNFEGSVARVDILARGIAGSGLIPVSYEIGTS